MSEEKFFTCVKCSHIGPAKKVKTIMTGLGCKLVISCEKCGEPFCFESIIPDGITKNDTRQAHF